MTFSVRLIFIFLSILIVLSRAFASDENVVTKTENQKAPSSPSIWGGLLNVARSTSLYDHQDGSRRNGMDYLARISAQLNTAFSLSAQGGYSQDLKEPENDDFSDTDLNLLRSPHPLGKSFLWSYRLGVGLPTSKDSKVRQSLLGSLSTGLRLSINPRLLIKGLTISGNLTVGQNFHQYETALDGRVNTKFSSTQSLSLGYEFQTGIFLSTEFLHRATWSYQNAQRNSFEMSQELGYFLNPRWSLAVGHSNSGSTLKPNGTDSNIQVFDDNESLVYASTSFRF